MNIKQQSGKKNIESINVKHYFLEGFMLYAFVMDEGCSNCNV